MTAIYTGRTDRGRVIRADSLQACCQGLAETSGWDPSEVTTAQDAESIDTWYVYGHPDMLTVDLATGNGKVTRASLGWFATVTVTEDAP